MSAVTTSPTHQWKFVRLGGLDQVVIETAADLENLHQLDPKLWVVLACPVRGLELDEKTLTLIDTDKDQRIRVPEVLAAVKWAQQHLKDVGDLLTGRDYLPLSAINTATADGQGTLASAKAVLRGLGKADADSVTLAEAADTVKLFSATTLNGDGIITVESAGDEAVKQIITEVISTVGATPDRSGKPGIDQARADTFFTACTASIDWLAKGTSPEVLTLGEQTAAAAAAVRAVRAKVDDYFARAQLAAFDPRAIAALNRSESEYITLAAQDLKITAEELVNFPISHIAADGGPLQLTVGMNPAWAPKLSALQRDAVAPAFGADQITLNAAEWASLKAKVAAYEAWLTTKAGDVVEKLGPDRIKEILAAGLRGAVNDLIAQDKALEPEFTAIHGVERLCRYTRDFPALLRNFVNFFDFYSPDRAATFQAGTLFLDSRSTDLCVQIAAPSPLAAMSKAYIAYCDCSRLGKTMKIAACFTQGDSDYLFVGRNGVFYDRAGNDWDAKITAVVDNPISVRQAFFLPYKKFVRFIEEQAAKRAAAAEAKADAKLSSAATSAADVTKGPAKPGEPKKVDVGAVAAIGVAISGAVTALTLILGYVFGLAAWQYPLVLIGLVLVISGPSMLIAWLKLRQRTVGPILEGNGWAINGRVKINVPFGTRLTSRAVLPAGSKRSLEDPYEDKETPRRARLILALALVLTAAAIRVHAVQFNDGYYFWQSKPVPVEVVEPVVEPGPVAAVLPPTP